MMAKEFLRQYLACEKNIWVRKSKIEEGRERVFALSQKIRERVQETGRLGGPQRMLEECLDQEKRFAREIREWERIQGQVKQVIACVKSPEYERLLELRYIRGLEWVRIIALFGYQERQIYRMHGKALEEVEGILQVMERMERI